MKKIVATVLICALCMVSFLDFSGDRLSFVSAQRSVAKISTGKSRTSRTQGQVLVELHVPHGRSAALLKEGVLSGDPTIRVRDVMDFGSTGKTKGKKAGRKNRDELYISYVSSDARSTDELKKYLSGYSYVKSVCSNQRIKKASVPNDPLFPLQWPISSGAFASGAAVGATGGAIGYELEEGTVSDKDAPIVAIIDTGVDYTHEDLAEKMWINPYKSLKGKYGYDFLDSDPDPMPAYDDAHGTMIAGIIGAATDNGKGVAGVSRYAKIMSLRVFTENEYGDDASILAAFEYIYKALNKGANIVAVNCSFTTEYSPVESEGTTEDVRMLNKIIKKIGKKGALVVFSAGNDSVDADANPYGVPSQLDPTYLLRVGAISYTGEVAGYSNYGAQRVELMAPGDLMASTLSVPQYIPEFFDQDLFKRTILHRNEFALSDLGRVHTIDELTPHETTALKIKHGSKDFYANSDSGSCCIDFKPVRDDSRFAYQLFYDITDMDIDPSKKYYVTYRYLYESDVDGEWRFLRFEFDSKTWTGTYRFGGREYMSIDLRRCLANISEFIGDSLYLDNLTISVADPDRSGVPVYGFGEGTSFAAPVVAGAIARLAVKYPKESAIERKNRLLGSVRRYDTLKGKCSSGGIPDLSNA